MPIAHRGLHDAEKGIVENSLSAALAAVDSGYGIELDVQLSADGEAMVFHDYSLERLTSATGAIRQMNASDLAKTKLNATQEGIPTLAELLDLVAGRVPVLVEIKDQDGALGPDVGPLEARVAEVTANYNGPLAVMSFNPHSVKAFAQANARIPLGLATCQFAQSDWQLVPSKLRRHLASIPDFDALGCSFVSHDRTDLQNPAVGRLKVRGVPILCWTVRSIDQERLARRIADNVTFEGYLPAKG